MNQEPTASTRDSRESLWLPAGDAAVSTARLCHRAVSVLPYNLPPEAECVEAAIRVQARSRQLDSGS
jgi:hypothetical protein